MQVSLGKMIFQRGALLLFVLGFAPMAWAEAPEINLEQKQSSFRIRASLAAYRYTIAGTSLWGNGPEVNFEKAIGQNWCVGGGIGQAYSYDKSLQTLFTSLDVSLWYSLWGKFTQDTQLWRDSRGIIANYTESKTGGLRFGFGSQQYFFNSASGAIPFSGFGAKLLYEFGLDLDVDFAMGIEYSRLINANYTMTSSRGIFSIVLPL
ncbi:MAG: hypothetical protein WCI18_14725 [Pseudomonadota bacterium]